MELKFIYSEKATKYMNFNLMQESLMIGTEGVLVPDIPSPLNSETLDITDYN